MNIDTFISKTLNVSTGHVAKAVADLLNTDDAAMGEDYKFYAVGESDQGVGVHFHDHGWELYVDAETIAAAHDLAWFDFKALLQLAMDNGCQYLRLDGANDELPKELGLPTYQW